VDSIITYYNRDYVELNLLASDRIRALGDWNKFVLREAFRPLVHPSIYSGRRGACIIRWDRMINGPFKRSLVEYLKKSEIIRRIFKVEHLLHLERMIKHPGLIYLNLLGLALWYDVNFNNIPPDTPLSDILNYRWAERDSSFV
jgi:hypothetical protein